MKFHDILIVLRRAMGKRCPQCGRGKVFARWYTLSEECAHCRLPIAVEDGDTWAFMYVSTAFLTGVIFVGMLITRPDMLWAGRMVVLVAALALIVGTLPVRKSMAIALNYLITIRWDNPAGHRVRKDE